MKKKTRIVELVISDDSQELTIDAISLVSSPAIEEDFVFFGKEKNNLTFAKIDEEKRMLVSPALIPNKQIYRYDAATDSDYYVWFSKDTVRKSSELYLKHNNHHKATYEHSDRVSGVLTIESWIKESEQDKSKMYGFDLPIGTWFVKMKIENDELWSRIKSGELKGLSIEGYFIDRMETMSKAITDEQIRTAYKELQAEGKVKVELGLAADLKKELNKIESFLKDYIKQFTSLKSAVKAVKEAEDKNDNGFKFFVKGEAIRKKYEQAAKELGINPDANNDYAELQDNLSQLNTLNGKLLKEIDKI